MNGKGLRHIPYTLVGRSRIRISFLQINIHLSGSIKGVSNGCRRIGFISHIPLIRYYRYVRLFFRLQCYFPFLTDRSRIDQNIRQRSFTHLYRHGFRIFRTSLKPFCRYFQRGRTVLFSRNIQCIRNNRTPINHRPFNCRRILYRHARFFQQIQRIPLTHSRRISRQGDFRLSAQCNFYRIVSR